ncbi:conserved hypothetical protein [Desulfosarcina cetonica]|uniref:bifunctional acetate--CoA ligase family protein/GNAT family N-acetyltransferase n=1 Tax=Desulfosarcina cetonica TaxID=90730 RepID=UPI000ACA90CF|nr:bifunctional acetate--CoA ligase family protein/GNAT family N-acetyltransferase [Desulfosarcina cetonica]VTR64871.1 conserved hypothetical protein [Desulfosarcina cetonica]
MQTGPGQATGPEKKDAARHTGIVTQLEKDMPIERLEKLFNPRRIAVVGASEGTATMGEAVMRHLVQGGFAGEIYPVNEDGANKNAARIMGLPAFPALTAIGTTVDLVAIAAPMAAVPAIVSQCSEIQAAGAVILSTGWTKGSKAHRQAERRVQAISRETGLRIIGPCALGMICTAARLNASLTPHLPAAGRLAFVSQSGAIGAAILDFALRERIGFSHFVSLGAMLDVDFGDMIDYLGSDPHVGSIVMYVENLVRHHNFMSAARSVSRIKPIIALKAGRSRAGAIAAASHTGSLAGEDAVYEAAFQRAGIVRVKTFEELFDTAEILSRKCRFRGSGLAVVTNAGGPGVMAADALSDYGLEPVLLSPDTIRALDEVLPDDWNRGNPIDMLGDATPERYRCVITTLSQAREVQALLIMLAPQTLVDGEAVARTIADQCHEHGKPVIASWLGGRDADQGREILNQAGIATFDTPERAVRAFMNLYRHSRGIEMLQQLPSRSSARIQVDPQIAGHWIEAALHTPSGRMTLDEANALLAAYGIPVIPTRIARSADAAAALAQEIGYPVVMKILSRDILHKSDVGGVQRDLGSEAAVRDGFTSMLDRAAMAAPHARIDGVALQPMITAPECELIMGAKMDPDFGPVILFGMGGILAELLNDRAIALPPLNRLLAGQLMEGTRVDRFLKGYRGQLPADRDQIAEILIRISQLVTDFPQIAELDINPLMVKNGRPLAVDARIIVKPTSQKAPLHLSVSPYPAQYESRLELPELGELRIRPIRPEDAELLLELFKTLSPRSVYYRFFSPMKEMSTAMLARFTQIDYDREIALAAIHEVESHEKIVGVARVILQHNLRDSEFSVLIGDPWHGMGIGAHLLATCIDIARDRGFGSIWGMVLAENRGMLAMGRKLNFKIKGSAHSGEFELRLDLTTSRQPRSQLATPA